MELILYQHHFLRLYFLLKLFYQNLQNRVVEVILNNNWNIHLNENLNLNQNEDHYLLYYHAISLVVQLQYDEYPNLQ